MSVAIIGTVALSSAAANVVHRNATVKINNVALPVKDMITDPTFNCNEGDTFWIQVNDVDSVGSVSPGSNVLGGTAQTPPPVAPTIGPVTFALA